MEIMRIMLYGRPFADRFTMVEAIRVKREMENEACLTYIQHGTQEVFFPIKKIIIRDGESVLMKCGNYIANTTDLSPLDPLSGVIFHLYPDMIKKAFGEKDLSKLVVKGNHEPVVPAIELGKNELVQGFVNSLESYFNKPELVRDELIAIKLQELITILAYNCNDHVRYILGSIKKKEIFEFEQIINENLYNNLSNPELAHLLNKSESSFKREFKKIFGESPARYLKTKKLEKAAELLKAGEKSISEISWECGFEDLAHFSSSFSSQYNMSPREYRKQKK